LGIGLRFHLSEMIAMWRIVVPGALIQSAISTGALGDASAPGSHPGQGAVLGLGAAGTGASARAKLSLAAIHVQNRHTVAASHESKWKVPARSRAGFGRRRLPL